MNSIDADKGDGSNILDATSLDEYSGALLSPDLGEEMQMNSGECSMNNSGENGWIVSSGEGGNMWSTQRMDTTARQRMNETWMNDMGMVCSYLILTLVTWWHVVSPTVTYRAWGECGALQGGGTWRAAVSFPRVVSDAQLEEVSLVKERLKEVLECLTTGFRVKMMIIA